MPGRFVVARSGAISFAESDPDYTVRPDPDVVSNLTRAAARVEFISTPKPKGLAAHLPLNEFGGDDG
jgi:hypothetical protein